MFEQIFQQLMGQQMMGQAKQGIMPGETAGVPNGQLGKMGGMNPFISQFLNPQPRQPQQPMQPLPTRQPMQINPMQFRPMNPYQAVPLRGLLNM